MEPNVVLTEKTQTNLTPFGEWLKQGWSYVTENWKMFLNVYLWSLLMYIVTVALSFLVGGVVAFAIYFLIGTASKSAPTPIIVLFAIALMVYIFGIAGKMMKIMTLASQSPVENVKALWKQISWKEGIAFYWIMLLMMMVFYSGILLLIIPGFIFITWSSLALYVKLNDGVGELKALMLSRDYVKGYGWTIFGRWFLTFIVSAILMGVLSSFSQYLMEQNILLGIIGFIIQMASSMLFTLFFYRLTYLIYSDLRNIKGKLELKASGMRKLGWVLMAAGPMVLGVIAIAVLFAINPAEQIKKAKEIQDMSRVKELNEFTLPSDLPSTDFQ